MLVTVAVGAYLATVGISVWGTAVSFLDPRSFWARHRLWARLATALEVLCMLQAPACVYLPRVPGRPAVRRRLIGTDAQSRIYGLETAAPMAFVCGPRWWGGIGDSLTVQGGPDWVAPLRYADWRRARRSLVREDGRRWPIPGWHGPVAATVAPEGGLLSLEYRYSHTGGLLRFKPDGRGLECVPPCGLPHLGGIEGLAVTADGTIWEIYEPGNVGDIYDRRKNGERLLRVRTRRRGATPQVFDVTVLQEPAVANSSEGPSAAQASGPDSVLLFLSQSRGFGEATVEVSRIATDTHQVAPVITLPYDPKLPVALAATADEAYYTTGQAIWDADGRRVQEIMPPFQSATWVGHTLVGVRPHPFFGDYSLRRTDSNSHLMSQAAIAAIAAGQEASLRRAAWILGGIDESGQEDVIVQLDVDARE